MLHVRYYMYSLDCYCIAYFNGVLLCRSVENKVKNDAIVAEKMFLNTQVKL
jgi:hypothetical protein